MHCTSSPTLICDFLLQLTVKKDRSGPMKLLVIVVIGQSRRQYTVLDSESVSSSPKKYGVFAPVSLTYFLVGNMF